MQMRFYEKDGFISPSLTEVYELAGEDDLEPISWQADAYTLCVGRHKTPCNDFIFGKVDNPIAFGKLERTAREKLDRACTRQEVIVVYVTGLTPALIAVLNVACHRYKRIVLMHYNKEDSSYRSQLVNFNIDFKGEK